MFERALRAGRAFHTRPMQQAVRVKGVPDPCARTKGKAHRRPALTDVGLVTRDLLCRDAVLGREIRHRILPLGAHVRVQLEGLEVNLYGDVAADALQRDFQRVQPHSAPGAGDVGDEVDFHAAQSMRCDRLVGHC
jgi:hypothetical protein